MGVAWITDIYQYSGRPVFMRSRDDQHNGIVNGQDFNDREWHIIPQGIHRTSYFAIPWFYLSESHHYKIISFYEQVLETPDNIGGIRLYTSVYNGQDSIYYVDQMGKTFARTALANGTDTNCKLVFPLEGGFYIDPINSGNPDPHTILNEAGQVVKTTIIELCQVTQAVASVAPLFG